MYFRAPFALRFEGVPTFFFMGRDGRVGIPSQFLNRADTSDFRGIRAGFYYFLVSLTTRAGREGTTAADLQGRAERFLALPRDRG